MELISFFRVLWRQKFILIAIPLITVAITFFLVRNLANIYSSRTRIATGIIDRPDAILNKNTPESKINQDFNNIIERILQKRTVEQVSYLLLLHDLKSTVQFRSKSKKFNALSGLEKQKIAQLIKYKYKNWLELNLSENSEQKLQDLLESMEYDNISIRKSLTVYRVSSSDFIDLQYYSENPQLSAFVLNNLSKEFIQDYSSNLNENKSKTIAYLDSMMRQKQDSLHKKMLILRNYKIRNGVLDVDDQATTLIGQIAQFEAQRQEAQKNINAYQGALRNIDARFNPNDRRYVESSLTELNQDILLTRNRLSAMNDDYIKSNFDSRMKARVDSLQSSLTEKINQTNDKLTYSPVASRTGLVQEKMNMEISLELAKNSVSSLSEELGRLNGKLYALVPNQAAIKTFQDDIELYSKEYNTLSSQYNQAILDANFTTKLKQIEIAMPGNKLPSKKLLLVLLSGVISFVCCVTAMFFIFFFDNSINSPQDLANKTDIPVIGYINLIKQNSFDLEYLWSKNNQSYSLDNSLRFLKTLLRAIRFEIDQEVQQSKVVAVTSLHEKAGKTFTVLNLAYAYRAANKRVAIIDGNFDKPELTRNRNNNNYLFIEDFLSADYIEGGYGKEEIVVFGNKGTDSSLIEIANRSVIHSKLQLLKDSFDIILIEVPSFSNQSKAKEWIGVSEKIISIFKAGDSISSRDMGEINYLKMEKAKTIGWIFNEIVDIPNEDLQKKKMAAA